MNASQAGGIPKRLLGEFSGQSRHRWLRGYGRDWCRGIPGLQLQISGLIRRNSVRLLIGRSQSFSAYEKVAISIEYANRLRATQGWGSGAALTWRAGAMHALEFLFEREMDHADPCVGGSSGRRLSPMEL